MGDAGSHTVAAGKPAAKLDDLMMAMDVVDTLRHQEQLVARELGQGERDEALKARLRKIYESQGLEVTDRILDEGIQALKESRFTYERKGSAGKRFLAMLWVRRRLTFGAVAAILLVCVFAVGSSWQQASSARQEAEAQRIELTETLPEQLQATAAAALDEANVEAARSAIERLTANGQTALRSADADGARKAIADLNALRGRLAQTYDLMIVQSGQSGVFRIPDVNTGARNYYLIVEAIDPDGNVLSMPVRNEETGETQTVSTWGVRVPERTFNAVRNDKQNDGVIQDRRLGTKTRGALEPEYAMPVSDGAITSW